jgi:ABC-type Zn uptake system ZnuABC Zn-binding protein ZnuA
MRQLQRSSNPPTPHVWLTCVTRLTLAHVLARITAEYGPTFASVTEEKLQTEIDKRDDEDVDMDDATSTQDSKKQVTREELIRIVQYTFRQLRLI